MSAAREPVIVVALAVLSLCPVMMGIALLPSPSTEAPLSAPWCAQNSMPFPGSVTLTPQSAVLLPKLDHYNVSTEGADAGMGFRLDAPAEFSGSWAASSLTQVFVVNVSSEACVSLFLPPAALNGSFNVTLFPGNYAVRMAWFTEADTLVTATQPWIATFDRALDVLQSPVQVALPPSGHVAWALTVPGNASGFFVEDAMETNSCNFELAMLPQAVYRAFASGQGPLNGTGTDLLERVVMTGLGGTTACGPSEGDTFFWCDTGPFNWTSGNVAVFYNAADYTASLYVYAPLEVSYLTG